MTSTHIPTYSARHGTALRKLSHHLALVAFASQHEAYEMVDQPSKAIGVGGNIDWQGSSKNEFDGNGRMCINIQS